MNFSELEHSYGDCKKVAEVSTQWMNELGADSLADITMKGALAFDLLSNVYKVAGVASSIMGVKNTAQTAEVTAMTSAMAALGPVGWGRIALATGAMVTGAAVTTGILHMRMKASLSDPSGVEAVRQQLGEVM